MNAWIAAALIVVVLAVAIALMFVLLLALPFKRSKFCDGRPEHRVSGPFGSTRIEDCWHSESDREEPPRNK